MIPTGTIPMTALTLMRMAGAAGRRRGRDRVGNPPPAVSPGLYRKAGKGRRQTLR